MPENNNRNNSSNSPGVLLREEARTRDLYSGDNLTVSGIGFRWEDLLIYSRDNFNTNQTSISHSGENMPQHQNSNYLYDSSYREIPVEPEVVTSERIPLGRNINRIPNRSSDVTVNRNGFINITFPQINTVNISTEIPVAMPEATIPQSTIPLVPNVEEITVTTERNFGVEIECFGIEMSAVQKILKVAGIQCGVVGYGHRLASYWKITTDSSVPDGFELVSPILCGEPGKEEIRKVCQALINARVKVDKRCGFHVHVNARDLTGADLINTAKRYSAFEGVIDGWMPENRRANRNRYCLSMDNILNIFRNQTIQPEESPSRVAGLLHDSRYHKLNLCAFARHGTVEFRQHSGTIDSEKIINWVEFCLNFVENSKVKIVKTEVQARNDIPGRKGLRKNSLIDRFKKLASCLNNSTYNTPVSDQEISQALECPVESVPSYVSQFRGAYHAQIGRRQNHGYFKKDHRNFVEIIAETTTRIVTTVEVPTEPGLFKGLSDDVVSYLQERAMEFSSTDF